MAELSHLKAKRCTPLRAYQLGMSVRSDPCASRNNARTQAQARTDQFNQGNLDCPTQASAGMHLQAGHNHYLSNHLRGTSDSPPERLQAGAPLSNLSTLSSSTWSARNMDQVT